MPSAGLAFNSVLFVPLKEPLTASAAFLPAAIAALHAPTLPSTFTVHIPPPFAYSYPSSFTLADFTAASAAATQAAKPKVSMKPRHLLLDTFTPPHISELINCKALIQNFEWHFLYQSCRIRANLPEQLCLI